jgi:hypothetical protein
MSQKKVLSKRQQLYYEYLNKDKIKQELVELAKQTKEIEYLSESFTTFDPHRISYFF